MSDEFIAAGLHVACGTHPSPHSLTCYLVLWRTGRHTQPDYMPIGGDYFFLGGGNCYWSSYSTITIAITNSTITVRMGYKIMLRAARSQKKIVCIRCVCVRGGVKVLHRVVTGIGGSVAYW